MCHTARRIGHLALAILLLWRGRLMPTTRPYPPTLNTRNMSAINAMLALPLCLMSLTLFGWKVEAHARDVPGSLGGPVLLAHMHQGMHSMPMSGMDMKHMMRPDMAPPVGIMGGMSPPRGRFMFSLGSMHMRMDGNQDGTNDLSPAEVLVQFPVTPLSMDMDMIMAGGMYGMTDALSVMVMIPYVWKSMDHLNYPAESYAVCCAKNRFLATADNRPSNRTGLGLPPPPPPLLPPPLLPPPPPGNGGGLLGLPLTETTLLAARSPSCNAPTTVAGCVLCEPSPAKKILLSATGT